MTKKIDLVKSKISEEMLEPSERDAKRFLDEMLFNLYQAPEMMLAEEDFRYETAKKEVVRFLKQLDQEQLIDFAATWRLDIADKQVQLNTIEPIHDELLEKALTLKRENVNLHKFVKDVRLECNQRVQDITEKSKQTIQDYLQAANGPARTHEIDAYVAQILPQLMKVLNNAAEAFGYHEGDKARAAIQRTQKATAGKLGGHGRGKNIKPLKEWAIIESSKHSGKPQEIAKKLMKNLPANLQLLSTDPERLLADTIRAARKSTGTMT